MVGYLEVLLDYCRRFYNRQFLTRKVENTDLLGSLTDCSATISMRGDNCRRGIPTVQYCADKLCLSANYFGDLIKKSTADTASHYIRGYVIQLAKDRLASGESIAQVAYALGFDYPQHFSRMFKKCTGTTPKEYANGG